MLGLEHHQVEAQRHQDPLLNNQQRNEQRHQARAQCQLLFQIHRGQDQVKAQYPLPPKARLRQVQNPKHQAPKNIRRAQENQNKEHQAP